MDAHYKELVLSAERTQRGWERANPSKPLLTHPNSRALMIRNSTSLNPFRKGGGLRTNSQAGKQASAKPRGFGACDVQDEWLRSDEWQYPGTV